MPLWCSLSGNQRTLPSDRRSDPRVRGGWFTLGMVSTKQRAEARRQATRVHATLGQDVQRLREDAGVSRRRLAEAAGISVGHLCRIEDGQGRASIDAYAKLALALGADLGSRLYPNTGSAIRDRFQAPILEALIRQLGPRWRPYPEVAVRHPSRGWVDALLHDARAETAVATEIQSDLRRLEQLLRWFPEKVASLPSWEGWAQLGAVATNSQLLIVRSTKATRAIGREFQRQLAAAYPAHPADALDALTGTAPWPGAALIWAEIEPDRVRFIGRR
jgi:transcriptional regulator with XRE-family HTH domain